ncbi:HEPN domain-containing protein [Dysgonomonas sp. Marseille-P4677]|uniref:HEPN domain-containing protein n=1 Tax=Dysgonomonas sp. Marseille-P4677 TaxID=2364790 RepID=UPI001914AA8F|nr:HEPN domain-containing protein [Dysgonomonas sp. Marseille-P4677]MBK5722690.1 HEPN domain-containing protein [Dysgonomonas sp. Marseille-P4677]
MKKSITYLPSNNKKELNFIVETVLQRLKQTEMIILYGSYARNDYVVYDEKYEFGKRQFYVSDYDLLVVTSGISDGVAIKALDNVEDMYYRRAKDPDRQPPVQFISEDMKKLNKYLNEGRYFYTQIKQEGVVLYDSGNFKLARRRKLSFEEIKQQAQGYFDSKFERGNGFLQTTKLIYDNMRDYQLASFNLHQACENYIYAIRLVFTLENPKQHNLSKLLNSVKKYSDEFIKVFPQDTEEEKRLFNLVKAAYVEGRYNPDFVVTKEDIDALIPKVELLRDITKRICEEKIGEYGEKKINCKL